LMARQQRIDIGLFAEAGVAIAAGLTLSLAVRPAVFDRIDDMLVTFVSIVVAASVPGVVLTASAPRPSSATAAEAEELGVQLSDQVRFWFGFLGWGSLAVCLIIVGHACEWELSTPRPKWAPEWVPSEGGRWLVFGAAALTIFTAIRARRAVRAAIDLISLGTSIQKDLANTRRTEQMAQVREQVSGMPNPPGRGAPVERRRA
jgi:hypothetical protein